MGRMRVLAAAAAVGALAGFAAVIWYAYRDGAGTGDGSVPVIKAAAEPFKRRPEVPGGTPIPNTNMRVFDAIAQAPPSPTVEHVLPGPEAPMPRPEPEVAAAPAAPTRVPLAEPAAPAPAAQPDLGPLIAEVLAGRNPPGGAPPQVAAATVARIAGWRVQLVSVANEEAARQAWAKARASHADLFAGLSGAIVPAALADRGTVYRLQVGPLRGRDAASALCESLKARRADCFVVAP
jgi:cell division septation protein DedD